MSMTDDVLGMADDVSSIAASDRQHHANVVANAIANAAAASPCPVHHANSAGLVAHIRRMRQTNKDADIEGKAPLDPDFVIHRRCTCARKGQLPDMRHEAAVTRDNTKRLHKSQHEQLRQYKDEARHLSRVSRAFREENARLQRVLEEKSRTAADAVDRASREKRRHLDTDTERAAWFIRMDDLRDENDVLTTMASKSRSEAEHLRAALDQAMSDNLKLRSALTTASTPPPQPQQLLSSSSSPHAGVGPSSLFVQPQQRAKSSGAPTISTSAVPTTTAAVAVGGALPPAQQRPSSSSAAQPATTSSSASALPASSAANGLAEDLNNLRQAVNLLRRIGGGGGGCTCSGGQQASEQQQQQQQQQQHAAGSAGQSLRDRCSVGLAKHRFCPAEGGGPLLSPTEKVDECMDALRRRVFAVERELLQARGEAERWHNSATELKNILDSINSGIPVGAGGSVAGGVALGKGAMNRVHVPGPNPRSATAGVTNLESQLEWAKGQLATLDFQLQTAHRHMEVEMEKLRRAKNAEIEAARRDAAQEVEARLRDDVRRTTSGAFLEELSTKLQAAERKIEALEVAATASEGIKRKQAADMENLAARLQSASEVAAQLEPTQRELAQAVEDRRVLEIRLRNAEGTVDALRTSEARGAEDVSALRVRASKAEERCQQLQEALNAASLKLHLEVEANEDLKQRLEDTVARYEASARRTRQEADAQLQSTQDRLRHEAVHRVHEEARASALEQNLRSVREEVERIRRVQLHW